MSSTITLESWVKASSEQVFTEVDDETVVLNLSNSLYYGLNDVGTDVWKRMQEKAQVCDLVTYIVDNYDGIERSACEKDILGLLHDLLKEDLIELCEAE